MAKVVRCRDVGFDCDGEVRADTEEEVLKPMPKPFTTWKRFQRRWSRRYAK